MKRTRRLFLLWRCRPSVVSVLVAVTLAVMVSLLMQPATVQGILSRAAASTDSVKG